MLDETKLFDFMKIMFTKPAEYQKLKYLTKKRHHFMINRFFAIKYPTNAQLFNINGIGGGWVVDCWALVAARFKSVPGWIYTKTKSAPAAKDKYVPDPFAVQLYLEKNEIGMRELEELKKFAPEALYSDLQNIERQVGVYNK